MLKKRIIASLIVKDNIVVQSIGFNKYLPVGSPSIAIEFLNYWGIDEIIMLDISKTKKNEIPDYPFIKNSSLKCHVPLTYGGGINNLQVIHELMKCGIDKVSFNNSSLTNKRLIKDTAVAYGNQCVVISIDVIKQKKIIICMITLVKKY